MIIFIYGPDTFRSRLKLNEIIASYRSKYKSGFNFANIELTEKEFDELKKKVETVSMFEEKKLIVLKNTLKSPKNLQDKIKKYLTDKKINIAKNIILIFFEDGEAKKQNSLFKFLLKNSFKKQEFQNLPQWKLKEFIKKHYCQKIDTGALDKIIEFFGDNLWQIEQELKKLIAYKNGGLIQEKDIEDLCETNINPNIFETIEAISKKNKKRALKLISEHIEKGENEIKILTMIIYQFRNIIKIKSFFEEKSKFPTTLKDAGIHPFAVRKTFPIAKNFSIQELKNIYQKLLELDFAIKTGKTEPKIGIEMFVMEI